MLTDKFRDELLAFLVRGMNYTQALAMIKRHYPNIEKVRNRNIEECGELINSKILI